MENGEKRANEKKEERKRKEKEEKTKFRYGIMFNLCILGNKVHRVLLEKGYQNEWFFLLWAF